jgi:hypothetical protein
MEYGAHDMDRNNICGERGAKGQCFGGRRSRTEDDVRMQGCVLEYTVAEGGEPLREEEFGRLFREVADRLCRGMKNSGRCLWIAHGIGHPARMEKGRLYYGGYEVAACLPGRGLFEKTLRRMQLALPMWNGRLGSNVLYGYSLGKWLADEAAKRSLLRCFGTGLDCASGNAVAESIVPEVDEGRAHGCCIGTKEAEQDNRVTSSRAGSGEMLEGGTDGVLRDFILWLGQETGRCSATGLQEHLGSTWVSMDGRKVRRGCRR